MNMDKLTKVWMQHLRPRSQSIWPREFGLNRKILLNELEYLSLMKKYWNTENTYCAVYSDKQINNHMVDTLFIEGRDWEEQLTTDVMIRMTEEARNTVNQFRNFGVFPRVYFSAGRGYHYYTDFDECEIKHLRFAANELLRDCKIPNEWLDTHVIGNMRAMARIPCTLNMRTRLYCIPVDVFDDPMNILSHSLRCKPYDISWEPTEDLDLQMMDYEEKAKEKQDYKMDIQINGTPALKIHPPCIVKIIAKMQETGYATHMERLHLVSYFRQLSWSLETSIAFFKKHSNDWGNAGLYHVKYAYKRGSYCLSCSKAADNHVCPIKTNQNSCPFYPSINFKAFGVQNGSKEISPRVILQTQL